MRAVRGDARSAKDRRAVAWLNTTSPFNVTPSLCRLIGGETARTPGATGDRADARRVAVADNRDSR